MPDASAPRWLMLLLVLSGLLSVGCGQRAASPPAAAEQAAPLTSARDLTVSLANTVLNRYAVLAADAPAGSTQLQVTDIGDLYNPLYEEVGPGDMLLVIQLQGAQINTVDSALYGTVTDLRSAGRYEFVFVSSVSGNTVQLACGGLRYSYSASGRTQVIRVPQLNNLTVAAGASVIAPPWDGQRGGVVALHVEGTTTLQGSIDVSGRGFRGGTLENTNSGYGITTYRSTNRDRGGRKGESIAGDWGVYDTLGGRYARGAPANGGGGGNAHNSAGGGGANGHNGQAWNGQGVMSATVTGAAAWALDPGYLANGNRLTTSSGGGRGGYSYSDFDADALTVAPGASAWGGDSRRDAGGLGGHPVDNDPTGGRLFLGGGGGASDSNSNAGSAGGHGGGLVILRSSSVTGTGQLLANGADAADTSNSHSDGAGGGGAGGTIIVHSDALSGISLSANGGKGGSCLITDIWTHSGGGGGGGGYIAVVGGTVSTSASGGLGGITTASPLTEFPSNGATDGASGVANGAPPVSLPLPTCALSDLSVSLTTSAAQALEGSPFTYAVWVENAGPSASGTVTLTFKLPEGTTFSGVNDTGWTCAAPSGPNLTCTYGNLPQEDAPELGITVVPTGSVLTLEASVSVSSPAVDLSPGNNSGSRSTSVVTANAAPLISAPLSWDTPEDAELVFSSALGSGLLISDADAANSPVQVILVVTRGTLSLGSTAGLAFTVGAGSLDTTMVFTGPLASVNAALEGLRFVPEAHYNGTATLTLTTNDLGNSGFGGARSDTRLITLNLSPENDPPTALPDTAMVTAFSTSRPIDVLANDSPAPDTGEALVITAVTQGSAGGTVTVLEGGTRLAYTPPPGFTGPDTFNYTVGDGNGGTAGAAVAVSVVSDSDRDGLSDLEEQARGTDPQSADSDGDALPDGVEVLSAGTDPLKADTDGGGVSDGDEVRRGSNPLLAADDTGRMMMLGCGCSASGPGGVPGLALWVLLARSCRRARPGRRAR